MLYLLVTGASWSGLPECVTSLPSWSCGFDSRHPLHPGPERDSGLLDAGDLTRPHGIGHALLEGIDAVDKLVLAAVDREVNTTVGDYDIDLALPLMTLKLVGYTEVVHTLRFRRAAYAAIVLFGGLAMLRPYPRLDHDVDGENGGVIGLMHTMIVELAPVRVNMIHPGIVGDGPYRRDRDLSQVIARSPCGRLAQMADIVDAADFLLRNPAVNAVSLNLDGGTLLG